MQDRQVLKVAILITLLLEAFLIIAVFIKIGPDRIGFQVPRVLIQLLLISFVYRNSEKALLGLCAYHILTAALIYAQGDDDIHTMLFVGYHMIIGLVMYFHKYLDPLFIKK